MKKTVLERNIVVVLFVLVLVVFSFAERDTRKLSRLYNKHPESFEPAKKDKNLASAQPDKKVINGRLTSN